MGRCTVSGRMGTVLALVCTTAGCSREAIPIAPAEAPTIPVSRPVAREVTDYVEFTGRTSAVQSVDLRPRVTGYLVKINFREGAEVKAGDVLFEIDPLPYKAQLDQASGLVGLYQAQLKLAQITYNRDRAINVRVPDSVSQQQLDQDFAAVQEAEARTRAYEKNRDVYQLNVDFTQVKSPIDGHVSRFYMTLGNLVNQDQTVLTSVVSQDPMYAYFDMDEPTLLRVRKAINEGKIEVPGPGKSVSVAMGIQGEEGYPHQGMVDFVDNQVDPTTGSILVRGIFSNPKPEKGVRLLSPGMFVRIRLPIGSPHQALLVIDRALGSDQGLKYLDIVDAKGEVQYRRVSTGALQEDGLRVIASGLKPEDEVVVGGLQQIRPKMKVQVERVTMPSIGRETPAEPAPPSGPAKPAPGTPKSSEATPAPSGKTSL